MRGEREREEGLSASACDCECVSVSASRSWRSDIGSVSIYRYSRKLVLYCFQMSRIDIYRYIDIFDNTNLHIPIPSPLQVQVVNLT